MNYISTFRGYNVIYGMDIMRHSFLTNQINMKDVDVIFIFKCIHT